MLPIKMKRGSQFEKVRPCLAIESARIEELTATGAHATTSCSTKTHKLKTEAVRLVYSISL